MKTPALSSKAVEAFYARLKAANPHPKGELEYVNPYTLLVAVVLSARATDAGVNKATRALFKIADDPRKMLALGVDALKSHVKTIGLYNTKAANIIALSKILVERHGGRVPGGREALEALPGVGRKTANVVLNIAFGEATLAVDTHVFRVANRVGLSRGKTPRAVEDDLLARTPAKYLRHAHHWLILHGRYVCKARAPRCAECVARKPCALGVHSHVTPLGVHSHDVCAFPDKTATEKEKKPIRPKTPAGRWRGSR